MGPGNLKQQTKDFMTWWWKTYFRSLKNTAVLFLFQGLCINLILQFNTKKVILIIFLTPGLLNGWTLPEASSTEQLFVRITIWQCKHLFHSPSIPNMPLEAFNQFRWDMIWKDHSFIHFMYLRLKDPVAVRHIDRVTWSINHYNL